MTNTEKSPVRWIFQMYRKTSLAFGISAAISPWEAVVSNIV